jgi:drug/metabolite transporter (DMT)-like permease
LLLGWLVFKQSILWKQVLGLTTAFAGIVLLVGSESLLQANFSWLHAGAVIFATVFYATSLNTIKHRLGHVRSLDITALAFSLTALPAWLVVYFSGTGDVVRSHTSAWEGLGFITILSAVGTCLAVFLFNRLIALKSAVFASSVTYIIPIVAVILGMVFLKESFHWIQLIGMLVIIGGVYVANNPGNRSRS